MNMDKYMTPVGILPFTFISFFFPTPQLMFHFMTKHSALYKCKDSNCQTSKWNKKLNDLFWLAAHDVLLFIWVLFVLIRKCVLHIILWHGFSTNNFHFFLNLQWLVNKEYYAMIDLIRWMG